MLPYLEIYWAGQTWRTTRAGERIWPVETIPLVIEQAILHDLVTYPPVTFLTGVRREISIQRRQGV